MILAKTVFILGAGASAPYGFPLGQGLRELICDLDGSQHAAAEILRRAGFTDTEVAAFAQEFATSGLRSIDAFLANRTDWEKVGKAALAAFLLRSERLEALNSVDGVRGRSDWYGELWNSMVADVQRPEQLIQKNAIKFITFNYDRSLEAFLHGAVRATFKLDDSEAFAVWSQFPIHHVYGSLGDYEPGVGHGVYGLPKGNGNTETAAIEQACASIKVVPAVRHAEDDAVARAMLTWADRVLILGFGFDPINCHRLGIGEVVTERSGTRAGSAKPTIFATVMGLTGAEESSARMRVLGPAGSAMMGGWHVSRGDCKAALREWGILLA